MFGLPTYFHWPKLPICIGRVYSPPFLEGLYFPDICVKQKSMEKSKYDYDFIDWTPQREYLENK